MTRAVIVAMPVTRYTDQCLLRRLGMPYRILCNGVQREGVKASPNLASGLFCYVPLHKIRHSISVAGETLAAQLLWGSGQHSLPPVLVRQRILVADTAAWRAGIWLVSIFVVRWVGLCHPRLLVVSGLPGGHRVLASRWRFRVLTLGIIFQVPADGWLIDNPLAHHPISIALVRKANGLGSQRVIGELLLGCLSRGMLGDLFFHSSHPYTSSPACCSVLPGCCHGECPSLPPPTASRFCCTSWVSCHRRCCCAIA